MEWKGLCCALLVAGPADSQRQRLTASWSGARLSGWALVLLFVGHSIKWPPMVKHFSGFLQARVNAELGGVPPREMVVALLDLLNWSHNRAFVEMHKAMNVGRVATVMGLVVTARSMGLLASPSSSMVRQSKRRCVGKQNEGSRGSDGSLEELPSSQDSCLLLGPALQPFRLRPEGAEIAERLFRDMIEVADGIELKWPESVEDTRAFVRQLKSFACAARSLRQHDVGLVGGLSENNYLVKHFVRHFLLVSEEKCAGFTQSIRQMMVEDILDWVPDQGDHLLVFRTWTCGQVQDAFGMSVFWLSCWLCLAASLSPEECRQCLKHPDASLLEPVLCWERDVAEDKKGGGDLFPPGPRVLVQRVLEGKSK